MVQFSNGRASAMAIAIVPTIRKPEPSKSRHFCTDFKWFLTKWRPFVWISNGWAFRFQMPFQIQTICNPTSFGPFEIQTRLDFRYQNFTLFKSDFSLGKLQDTDHGSTKRTAKVAWGAKVADTAQAAVFGTAIVPKTILSIFENEYETCERIKRLQKS